MPITYQQSFQNFRNSAGTTVIVSVTAGAINDLVCVGCLNNNSATMTVADDKTNTWFTANPIFSNVADRGQSFYCFAKNTSAMSITLTCSGSVTFAFVLGSVFRGTDLTSAVLGTLESAVAGTGSPISDSFAPDEDDCAVWAWCADSVTSVGNIDGSAATKGADDTQQDWSEYRILTGRKDASMTAAFNGTSGAFSIGVVCWRPPQPSGSPQSDRGMVPTQRML